MNLNYSGKCYKNSILREDFQLYIRVICDRRGFTGTYVLQRSCFPSFNIIRILSISKVKLQTRMDLVAENESEKSNLFKIFSHDVI